VKLFNTLRASIVDTTYELDIVADRPYIDQHPIFEFAEIETPAGGLRVLHLEDAIADRIAAFVHRSDSESLGVAERAAAAARDRLTWEAIDLALRKVDTRLPESAARMTLASERLRRALIRNG